MIPNRFVTEYPVRCLELLDAMQPIAEARDLLGSFALLTAASILNMWLTAFRGDADLVLAA
jgi:hypothetical protein